MHQHDVTRRELLLNAAYDSFWRRILPVDGIDGPKHGLIAQFPGATYDPCIPFAVRRSVQFHRSSAREPVEDFLVIHDVRRQLALR